MLRSVYDVAPLVHSGRLRVLLPEWRQQANIWAVYPVRLDHSAKVRTCVEFLQQCFAGWQPGAALRLPEAAAGPAGSTASTPVPAWTPGA